MIANTHSVPDRRRVVGSWVLTVVLSVLTLGSLAGKAEAMPGGAQAAIAESARAA